MQYRELDKLQPNFRLKVDAFMSEVSVLGVFITETWRSDEDQMAAYKAGTSKIDGKSSKSNHQLGLAIDIAFQDDPRTSNYEGELYPEDYKRWREIADIAKKYGMNWGYDMWQWDKPHFEDDGSVFVPGFAKWEQVSIDRAVKEIGLKQEDLTHDKVWTLTVIQKYYDLSNKK